MLRHLALLIVVVWIVLSAVPAEAAITRVDFANCEADAATTTMDCTLTVSGTNPALFCGLGINNNTDSNPTARWDPAGANESLVQLVESGAAGGRYLTVFRLAPPTAVTDGIVRFSDMDAGLTETATCVSYSDVDGADPEDTFDLTTCAAAVSHNTGTITSPAGDMILGWILIHGTGTAPTETGDSVLITSNDTANITVGAAEDLDGADDDLNWAWSGSTTCRSYAVNVNAAGGGAPAGPPAGSLMLIGVGK